MSYKWPKVKSRPQDCSPVIFSDIKERTSLTKPWFTSYPSTRTAPKGRQVTCSFRHRKFPDGDYHSGGPFFTARNAPRTPTRTVTVQSQNGLVKYTGPVVQPLNFGDRYTKPPAVSQSHDDSHLDKYGAEAISAVDPLNPNAEVGVALGEIIVDRRISLPGIQAWKRRTEKAKAAGSEYLSAQFGWLPLVEEIKNTIQSVRDSKTIIENYESMDGHEVHREFEFEPIESTEQFFRGTSSSCWYSNNVRVGSLEVNPYKEQYGIRKQTIRRWFSGTFIHHPEKALSGLQEKVNERTDEIDKLFGLTPTPDLIWELAPWSWAIDWFSNAGDVVSNFTSFELLGLVMKYGFIMEETSGRETLFMPSTGLTGVSGPAPNIWNDYSIKRRKEANPFGFGVAWEDLSPTQLAITAALGITRLR